VRACRVPLLLLALCLGLAACGERPEPVQETLSAYPVTVRGAGEAPTALARRPQRVVALASGGAELVEALGAGERLVGVPSAVVGELAPGAASVVRPSGRVDADAVVRLAPDLVVAASELDPDTVEEIRRTTDAAVYLQPDRSLRDVHRAAIELGFLLGEPVLARRLASSLQREIAAVDAQVAEAAAVRVFVDTGFLTPAAADSLVADLVRRAGGVLVEPEGGSSSLDPCELIVLNPDVILRVVEEDAEGAPPQGLPSCPSASGPLPRTAEVDAELVMRAGPRAGEGLAAVADAIHSG
jgi:iron complex transport system substrate-binding protein